jgi:hypothetical protein
MAHKKVREAATLLNFVMIYNITLHDDKAQIIINH